MQPLISSQMPDNITYDQVQTWINTSSEKMARIILEDRHYELNLSKYIDYFEDPTGNIDIAAIIGDEKKYEPNWISNRTDNVPSFGYTESSYWIRLLIENQCSKNRDFVLEIAHHYHDYVDLYELGVNGKVRITKTGDQFIYNQRPIDYQNFAFPISIEPNQKLIVMIRIRSYNTMIFPLVFWTSEQFNSAKSTEMIIFGMYYGMISVMVLYNFFLFILIRDLAYLMYVLYAISYLIFQAGVNGVDFRYLWPENIFLANSSFYIAVSFVDLFFAIFTKIFLKLKARSVFFNHTINFFIIPGSIMAIILSSTGSRYSGAFLSTLNPIAAPILIIISITCLIKGYRPARFYVIAFSALLIGATIFSLKALGILPSNILTEYGIQIGSAIEIVLLSFALGDKIRIEQMEAQKNIEELNNGLEKKVEDKTRELIEANKKLKEIDKYKTTFFQNVSHELRTPLTLVINPIENAQISYPLDKDISTALKNSKRLLRLVNQLLDFQKYSLAGSRLDLAPVNLTELVISVGDYFREPAEKKNIEFIIRVNNEKPDRTCLQSIFINGHVDSLEKIIFNYLSNALKYVRENGTITLQLQQVENMAIISVIDDGIGITPENQKKLFKLFSQLDDSASKPYEGTGLGLALSKDLAEKMHGYVDVISKYGEGSCFTVTFPISKTEKPFLDLVMVLSEEKFQEDLIRIVDCNPEFSKNRCVDDLYELKTICKKYKIKTLIMDETMLGTYGEKALSEIQYRDPDIKIFVLRSERKNDSLAELESIGILLKEVQYPRNAEKVFDEILKDLFEIRMNESRSLTSKHKIKDWFLADTEDPEITEEEIGLENRDNMDSDKTRELILVVDDNIDMVHLISKYLRSEKYRVSIALNGKEALKKCYAQKPDIIISDWMMPLMSGPELLQAIRADQMLSSIPIVLLTAKSDETSKKEGTYMGADAFLGKPFDYMELISLVKNLLKLKQGEKKIASINQEIANGVLRRFLPPELIDRILNGEAIFETEPKNMKITILFATLSNIKDKIDELGTQKIVSLLKDYYIEMTKIISSHKGIIDRFEDGSIIALFGVPSPMTANIQVENACFSALEMEKNLRELSSVWVRKFDTDIGYKIAIHHGEAIVGMVGGPQKTDYTAIGSAIYHTRFIESFVKDGEILISKEARDHLRSDMWVKHSQFAIDGTDKKITLSRVVSPQEKETKAG
ncbi:MAG: response regulator [Oligoflexales bacterium]|nr:response regulator [Oligoflexales bacterium]